MRPVLDVLVPFDLLASLGPFEVQLRVVELDVRPDQIGDDVGDDRPGGVVPVPLVVLHRAGKAAEPRIVRSVAGLEVEHRIGFRDRAALFHPFRGDRPHLLHHFGRDDAFDQEVAVVEVELPLLLGKHAGRSIENLFWSHVRRLRECSEPPMFDPVPDRVNRATAGPHISPTFVARARRCRRDKAHGPKERIRAAEGVADTSARALSKRLEGVRLVTAGRSAPRAQKLGRYAGQAPPRGHRSSEQTGSLPGSASSAAAAERSFRRSRATHA